MTDLVAWVRRDDMRNHDFDHGILDVVDQRPWPMPDAPWIMTQTWHDLLFAHWPVDKVALRTKVPALLELDLYEGIRLPSRAPVLHFARRQDVVAWAPGRVDRP